MSRSHLEKTPRTGQLPISLSSLAIRIPMSLRGREPSQQAREGSSPHPAIAAANASSNVRLAVVVKDDRSRVTQRLGVQIDVAAAGRARGGITERARERASERDSRES